MKFHRAFLISALLLFSASLTGCFSSGTLNARNVTEVHLSKANYKIIATSVRGEASAGYLLGVSYSAYGHMKTIALARVDGSGLLYEEALANLWKNFYQNHGPVEEGSIALINIVYDTDALNLLLYTKPTVSVRADVIKYVEEN